MLVQVDPFEADFIPIMRRGDLEPDLFSLRAGLMPLGDLDLISLFMSAF